MSRTGEARLPGAGSECEGHSVPGIEERERGRQVQHDAPYRDHDVSAELEQLLAQGPDLSASQAGARGGAAHLLEQHIGGGAEQHAQLIGPEPRAAGAIDLDPVMELLDPVLELAACTVDALVDPFRAARQVGDHEARVVPWLPPRQLPHLAREDDAALLIPGPRG